MLAQGTFGATIDEVDSVSTETYGQWFADQVGTPPTLQSSLITTAQVDPFPVWWTAVVNAPDQLRQRVSFALSEIFVISEQNGGLAGADQRVFATYEDLLTQGAFGNLRDLLDVISHSIQMGVYLTYYKNQKENASTGVHPDENYAREIMQLFTVGLVKLNPDGTPQVDSAGVGLPTYGQAEVDNMARVFTGWGSTPVPPHTVSDPNAWMYDYDLLHPLACYQNYHDTGAKTIIDGTKVPAGGTCDGDMKIALDTLFNHPNAGPFFGKQLIQRLVTSNPSPAYVGRVAAVFNNDGKGVRGNMLAVVEAILTDTEATKAGKAAKLREPILFYTNLYRAFSAADMGDSNIDEYQVVDDSYNLWGEAPLYSSTVFNFFRPNYLRPGPLLTAGLVAPEFQVLNELTVVNMANQLEATTYQYMDSAGNQYSGEDNYPNPLGAQNVILKTAAWEPLAANPGMLVDKLNLVLMQGSMPDAMRSTIVNYITTITGGSNGNNMSDGGVGTAAQRVIDATFLVMSSPQYAIQR